VRPVERPDQELQRVADFTGFAKRKNQDYEFLATVLFFQEHLLK